jgi:acylphosphatase
MVVIGSRNLMMVMKTRVRVHVTGRVQGVFFRAETAELAQRLGLEGWVRNLPDGRVEALFEGEKQDVEKAVAFCRQGPPRAQVRKIDVEWENWKGEFSDFRVRY